jgi:hypothetical protein
MSIQTRPLRARFRVRASKRDARPDNRLAFLDQATFLSMRATGRAQLAQAVWVHKNAVDFDGLRRLNRNLGHGLLGRRIERSPLAFGRHRWVASEGPPLDIDVADCARPRAELSDWADEHAQLPIDPEWGPGWRMGVLPLTDGSTAVSLVVSHNLVDGSGAAAAIIDAVNGNVRDFGYPPPRSRRRLRAVLSDARQAVQDAPEVARAVVGAAKLLLGRRQDTARPAAPPPAAVVSDGADCDIVVPTISISIDLDDWDARTKILGGAGYSLLAGFAAKLGERMGRCHADGAVTLLVPISDRTTLEDTRANAISFATVSVDPARVTTDLSGIQALLVDAWWASREASDQTGQLLALTPFIPKRALKRAADQLFGFTALPVICSNLGDLPPEVNRPDGTDAEYLMLRGVDQNVTRKYIESVNGQLVVAGGRLAGKMSISVVAYQPGGTNSKPHLREVAAQTLAEFDLTGVID